ncbi:prepilin peptidase [Parerythrobacter aurantius]|uniref:prepilin peptidase n=1 Tax=Parerythrobacter aurantius TaxID=3127706 RepID=UPI00325290A8
MMIFVGAALAIHDILHRKLPNWLVAVMLGLSAVYGVLTLGWAGFALAATHGLVTLLVGALLFHWKVIGAGDAKFYSAIATSVPWSGALSLIWWTTVGGVLLLFLLLGPIVARRRKKLEGSLSVPFGVAIFVGLVGIVTF